MPTHQDTFTGANGTALSSHTPDVGGGYEDLGYNTGGTDQGSPSLTQIQSNRCAGDGANNTSQVMARATTDPGADEYDVAFVHGQDTGQASRTFAVEVRASPTGTANNAVDRYTVYIVGSTSPTISIDKTVGGTRTELDSAAYTLDDAGNSIKIEVRASGIAVLVNDVATLSTDDTAITQRGRVTIGATRSQGNRNWGDDLTVTPVAAAFDPANLQAVVDGSDVDLSWDPSF